MDIIVDTWQNCYPSQWKGLIVEDAIAHPAKFSSKLIRRIYEHMVEEGWVKPGDVVIDPFGGVALGSLDAMRLGLRWRGVELEQRFVDLGNANIGFWNERFGQLPKWSGDAVLLQGDSRNLVRVLSESGESSVSSPPYNLPMSQDHNGSRGGKRGTTPSEDGAFVKYGSTPGQLEGLPMSEEGFEAAISSPPFADSQQVDNRKKPSTAMSNTWEKHFGTITDGSEAGQLGNMRTTKDGFKAAISSPPFLQSEGGTPEPKEGGPIDKALYARHKAGNGASQAYGESDGNLGNMRDEGGFQAAISSPPYADGAQHTGGNDTHPEHIKGGKIHLPGIAGAVSSPPYAESMERKGGIDPEKSEHDYGPHSQMANSDTRYGSTSSQLGAMPAREESFEASVSSPPFESTEGSHAARKYADPEKVAEEMAQKYKDGTFKGHSASKEAILRSLTKANEQDYGTADGNLGNDSGSDFWLAARAIVEQTYQALAPGAHAVWVVKDFVKNKERVPFCTQWRQLCEAVGFITLHEHHAMLVHRKGSQHTLDGNTVELKTESKSFFRRLAEKNGSPRIDWEVVLCMEKPGE